MYVLNIPVYRAIIIHLDHSLSFKLCTSYESLLITLSYFLTTEIEFLEIDKADTTAPTLSFSTETTTSWMKEAGMDADIRSYARGSLLRRDEYFFRIWYYARQLFK